ncbi:hypothetical protein DV515_00012340 [Chloebia gouldiae]|uniref:Uncharacterized protein n=1 Tax=Chloebia gouldiae TaxID=44316 RepID=A0A3L8S3S8_CHLGU|nr:hypothetical protein DV515_00012340 [Chloebia gouldiae]
MGSKSPGNNTQRPAFFSKLTESNSAMVKSKKQEIIKKLSTTNKNETEYSKNLQGGECGAAWDRDFQHASDYWSR